MRHAPAAGLLACLVLPLLAAGEAADDARFPAFAADCAKVCAPCLDDYLVVPGFDARRGSSHGEATDETRKRLTLAYTWRHHGRADAGRAEPSGAELHAAQALPALEQGAYGFVASAEVARILGPRDMVVSDLRLADLKEAQARTGEFLRKTQAAMDQAIGEETRTLDTRIAALEKEKKGLEAWRRAGQSAGSSAGTSSSSQNDPSRAKLDELARQIRALETQKGDALREERANKAEVARVAKDRLKPFQDAEKTRSKFRKELSGDIRLVGFDTTKLRRGTRFGGADGDGFQAAVAFKDADGRWVLASPDLLKAPLDAKGLRELLARRGAKVADFVQAVARAREGRHGDDAADAAREAMARWMKPLPEDGKAKKRKSED